MSTRSIPTTSSANTVLDTPLASQSTPAPLWDRLSAWASENRGAVYIAAGVAVVITGAGAVYYLSDSRKSKSGVAEEKKKASKKERRKAKKEKEKEKNSSENETSPPKPRDPDSKPNPTVETDPLEGLPQIDESTIETLSDQERKEYATKLKAAGNKAYGDKRYNEAIDLYGQAIICQPDPIFYSNRAACYNALGDWDKVIEDTTAAIALNSEYVKALNRRANAYEHLERYSEALLDYTASCIIDGFRNESSAQSVERLLKKVAEAKGKAILEGKEKKLPSSTFVTNYLQSFRPRPAPDGLEESAELDEETGKGQLKDGLIAMEKKTSEGYEEASKAFDRALELDDLGDHEAFAYNMRGTFRYLRGENSDALQDLSKSVELQPSLTQSFIKRASMHLELGNREAAANDFDQAMEQKKDDPDIYYHRAQLHFILGEFAEAAKDYQKSIDLDKNFIFSHIQLGVTQYKMGSIASSMATFRRCIKNFDKIADVYNYYGELLLDQQKYQEAIEKFDTAVEMEMLSKPLSMNVLPLINKALALFQWKQDYQEAEKLCQKALIIDPECDIAVATMAQLLLQQGKVTEALKYFERAAELSRTEGEIVNALSYAEATRTQLEVTEKYPQLASRLHGMSGAGGLGGPAFAKAEPLIPNPLMAMVAPRRNEFIKSRRRVEDDGEEEEGSVAIVLEDDSLSEGSALSDVDDDADVEGSEATDVDASERQDSKTKAAVNGHKEVANPRTEQLVKTVKKPSFVAAPDTEVMMNGLQISDNTGEGEGVSFDDMMAQPSQPLSQSLGTTGDAFSTAIDSPGERRRREHDEYKKKRDADPAFVPNRGGFFMHDHRSNAPGQNGFRPIIKGRGRGRGGFESSFPPVTSTQRSGPADAPWAHDLHESIAQPVLSNSKDQPQPFKPTMGDQTKAGPAETKAPPPNRSFSRTSRIGNVQIRVYLAGMSDPIIFSTVPVNQHTRLPHHRPPLRRDKPVRIAIPNLPVRYIFPAMDRSFIFIPRALRPNQQGFGRSRGRGSFSGVGGFPSRRTSAFGGSNYSPSVTMSRRSSNVRDIAPDSIISPTDPAVSRPLMADPGKPIVRLPPAAEQAQMMRSQVAEMASVAPVVNLPLSQAYPSTQNPQNPALRENRQGSIPMHQPRPQKTVSVAEIESPAFLDFNPPQQQQQQPFHQQVPAQVIGQIYQQDSSTYPHSRHPSHPSQASSGTPLQQIPERALQAMPFQAYPYQPPPNFYPPQYGPPVFFYPPAHTPTHGLPSAAAPSFVPGQQISYIMPAVAPTLPPPPSIEPIIQAGTVAHESNGMVYYYDSSQLAATSTNGGENNAPYPPTSYAITQPGVLNISGIPTPPMHYYPQPTAPIFYPPQ